jgi:hypothetical protein
MCVLFDPCRRKLGFFRISFKIPRGLPEPNPRASGCTSWDIYSPDGKQVSLKDALQKAGVGNGEDVRIRQWSKTEEDTLKAYLYQRISNKRIAVLMRMNFDVVEKKIKEKGWLVWKGGSKNEYFTKI